MEKVWIAKFYNDDYACGEEGIFVYDEEKKAVEKLLRELRTDLDIPKDVPDDEVVPWVRDPDNLDGMELDNPDYTDDHCVVVNNGESCLHYIVESYNIM